MKKHKLLEKAMRDYPKGTKFVPPYLLSVYESTGVFVIDVKDVAMVENGNLKVLVYTDNNTWAAIVQ